MDALIFSQGLIIFACWMVRDLGRNMTGFGEEEFLGSV